MTPLEQRGYRERIMQATTRAAAFLDGDDLSDAEWDEQALEIGERNHCGVCQVRHAMRIAWPAIRAYINALETELGLELTGGSEA